MQTIATAQLKYIWHQIIGNATGHAHKLATCGVNFANKTNAPTGTAAWYAAAIWRYNQG